MSFDVRCTLRVYSLEAGSQDDAIRIVERWMDKAVGELPGFAFAALTEVSAEPDTPQDDDDTLHCACCDSSKEHVQMMARVAGIADPICCGGH